MHIGNYVMYWGDIKINKLINDLNTGKVQINANNKRDNQGKLIGFSFNSELLADYNNYLTKP